ncbi:MAG TPA: response regulator transcription factor [bacterium]|nr:response regulator transcription factor [bacterium]
MASPQVAALESPQGGGPHEGATASERIQIVVVDDEDLFRDLLSSVLSASGNVDVIGAFPDAETAMEATRRLHPRVVVLDIELSGSLNGIQAGLLIQKEFPDIGIVWLSAYKRPYLPVSFQQQMTSGWAYLLKKSGTNVRTLAAAIDGVARGLVVLDPEIAGSIHRLLNAWIPPLSPSQYDVLALMAQGLGNAAIAQALHLPEKSVESQVNQIYHHLRLHRGVDAKHRRVEAVLRYLREGSAHTRPDRA